MANVIEQRACIEFYFRNEISATKASETLQKAFKDDCLSKTTVFDWYKKFKDGRESVIDDLRSGRPSTSINDQDIDNGRELVLGDRRLTIRDIIEQVPI
ncbi:Putative uncharacterized protein FLJ37770 [Araneus ventricosus]|uniref:Mos1 transposase HTH domain-containing protein n=1 Tax=Araneus ventricosus TaxID=182803 RepID=A0A4Y2J5P8_ARAVE|nr:Putative uncharacterized protein FLJ37770 [Araneus ventricosus]